MMRVAVKGDLDKAIKKFKRNLTMNGVPSECKKRECYDKPGIKRREAKKAGIKNTQRRNKKNNRRDYA